MTLEGVIFDFDGVLANSEPLHLRVYQELLAGEGLAFGADEYYADYLGFDDVGAFQAMARLKGLRIDDGRLEDLIARKTTIFQALVGASNVLFPGAELCLREMAAACPIAIASGALRHEIELILGAGGLLDLVPVIVAAGDTPKGKPAPDPFALALERLSQNAGRRLAAGRTVAIEDSRWGLESARAVGLTTVALSTSYPAEELGMADLVLPGIDQVTPVGLDRLVAGRGPAVVKA
jgi:beta-phosphoglucomutase-like phosphatase (HAD superfamily)